MKAYEIVIALDLCNWGPHEYISTKQVLVEPPTEGFRPTIFMKHVENIDLVKSINVLG